MEIKDLLAKLAELRQSNSDDQDVMDTASLENSEATINPSMFTARKQQELKGLPKEDIQDVVSQTKDYVDPRIADMASMSGGISAVGKSILPKIAEKTEPFLDKLRDTKFGDSFIGKAIDTNIRQPLKRSLNEMLPITTVSDVKPQMLDREAAFQEYAQTLKDPDYLNMMKQRGLDKEGAKASARVKMKNDIQESNLKNLLDSILKKRGTSDDTDPTKMGF